MMTSKKQNRRQEILTATAELYQRENYRDINIKEISKVTSISRPSIYNYFETKEEIFLTMLTEEYLAWSESLNQLVQRHKKLTREELAQAIAQSIAEHPLMVKLISNNLADFEENSRMSLIVSFKESYGKALLAMESVLRYFLTDWTKEACQDVIYALFPFLMGIEAYVEVTDKQKEAMNKAKVPFKYHSIYQLTYQLLAQLLHVGEKKL